MVAIRLASGEKVKCANSWKTCSTEVFQNIIQHWEPEKELKDRSVLKLFNILIGFEVSPEEDDLDLEAAIWECTRFVYMEPMDFTKLPVPKTITVGGKVISFPQDLGRLKIGQNIHVRQELLNVKDANVVMAITTAIYLQPLYDKLTYGLQESLFDFHSAKNLEREVLKMSIVDVYPIGFFFLKQLRSYGTGWQARWSRKIQRIMTDVKLLLNSRKVNDLLHSVQQQ